MESPGITVNRLLTKLAKQSRQDMLQRVANVQQIRTLPATISLFISSAKRLKQLQDLHAAVQSEQFTYRLTGFDMSPGWVPFVLEMPQPLHTWLKDNSWASIEAQVLNWLAALYAANCRRDELVAKLSPTVKQLARSQYSRFDPRRSEELVASWAAEYERARERVIGRWSADVLRNPFALTRWPFLNDASVLASFRFSVRVGYFTQDDWLFIVERDKRKIHKRCPDWPAWKIAAEMKRAETDTLDRSLADASMWQAWLQHFGSAESLLIG